MSDSAAQDNGALAKLEHALLPILKFGCQVT